MKFKRAGTAAVAALGLASMAAAAPALAGKVKIGAVKGGHYAGVVHGEDITLAVAANGKTARVSLPDAPAFCPSGSGPVSEHSKPSAIDQKGTLNAKLGYSARGSASDFATVTVKGTFFTFAGQKPVFQGVVKSKFKAAGARTCDGQESFQATLG